MMGTNESARVLLRKEALEAYREEYKELIAVFQTIDGKAQGTVAISGIFLAGTFALLPSLNKTSSLVPVLFFSTTFLVLAVALAVLTMRVRDTPTPPSGDQIKEVVASLMRPGNRRLEEELPQFYGEIAQAWSKSVHQVRKLVHRKAELLWFSQISLVIAILSAAASIFLRLL